MSSRAILLAALTTTALLAGGVGGVAATGSHYDTDQTEPPEEPGVDELPRTLPEAVGYGLTLLGQLADAVPASADDVAQVL